MILGELMASTMISFDPSSTCTGYAVWEDGKLKKYNCIDLKSNKDTEERMLQMCTDILFILNKYSPAVIYTETPDGYSILAHKLLSKILGVIYGWSIEHRAYYEEFKPVVWRKLINISQGKKKRVELKQLDIEYVKNNFDINLTGYDDVADSICIGAAGLTKYSEVNKKNGRKK